MDLLIEKGDKRTYLSRYKVITTSFEESSPSVKRNNTQIQYRNGNVDFGGWNEDKKIDYVGYYRADDLEDEEHLRERIYALLSDPEGYYITQLKNDNDDRFERPGETSGDYFDKQINRPSHKRFYVYASSLESELVGSYGGHVLYKISATFTTMKLPYGESVPRDLEIKSKTQVDNSAVGTNLAFGTSQEYAMGFGIPTTTWKDGYAYLQLPTNVINGEILPQDPHNFYYTLTQGVTYTQTIWLETDANVKDLTSAQITWYTNVGHDFQPARVQKLGQNSYKLVSTYMWPGKSDNNVRLFDIGLLHSAFDLSTGTYLKFGKLKLEKGSLSTDWCLNPSDPGYNEWYLDTYYNTDNLIIPYAGTVPCSQLEQGFVVEFTTKVGGSGLKIDLNGTDLTYSGQVYSGDVIKLSGYEYTKNGISIVKDTNKAYFKLFPGIANKISSSIKGTIRILGFQDLYA